MENGQTWTYTIPYQGQYIVYRPLQRLAFVGNAALVNLIANHQYNPSLPRPDNQASRFLSDIDFWEKDRSIPDDQARDIDYKPSIATLFLTTACNMRCSYCYASAGESKVKTLPSAVGRQAIDIVCQNALVKGEKEFILGFHGGGEPTLARKSLTELITYARNKPLPCRINIATNGLLSNKYREWLLAHIDELSLSFDGIPAIQNVQRPLASGGESFNRVLETIRVLDQRDFPYGIRMTVTDNSLSTLCENVTFLCKETGCRSFQIEPAFDHGRAKTNRQAMSRLDDFAQSFMKAFDIAKRYKRNLYYSGARPWVITNMFCQATQRALVVEPGGAISACYEVFSETHPLSDHFVFGKVFSDSVSVDMPRRNRLLVDIQERRRLCKSCFCYWHCAGDCPAKTFTPESDGHLTFGPRCDLNRILTRELLARAICDSGGVWRGESWPI